MLRKAISAGEIADFQARVPKDVAAYLARAWREDGHPEGVAPLPQLRHLRLSKPRASG
jgi:hypothetical protein